MEQILVYVFERERNNATGHRAHKIYRFPLFLIIFNSSRHESGFLCTKTIVWNSFTVDSNHRVGPFRQLPAALNLPHSKLISPWKEQTVTQLLVHVLSDIIGNWFGKVNRIKVIILRVLRFRYKFDYNLLFVQIEVSVYTEVFFLPFLKHRTTLNLFLFSLYTVITGIKFLLKSLA